MTRVRSDTPSSRHLRDWRDLPFRGRLPAGQGTARSCGERSRSDPTQEHRRPCPGLFPSSRSARRGEACGGPSVRKIWAGASFDRCPAFCQYRRRSGTGLFRRRRDGQSDHRPVTDFRHVRDLLQHGPHVQKSANRRDETRTRTQCALRARRQRPARWRPRARQRAVDRSGNRGASLGRAVR